MGCFQYATELCEPDDMMCLFFTTESVLGRVWVKNLDLLRRDAGRK